MESSNPRRPAYVLITGVLSQHYTRSAAAHQVSPTEFAPAIFTRCVALIQACIVATATAQLTGNC
eukprot:3579-Heterococcus_DN1.PRE.2